MFCIALTSKLVLGAAKTASETSSFDLSDLDFVTPAMNGIVQWFYDLIAGIWEFIICECFSAFEPTSDYFYEQIFGTAHSNTHNPLYLDNKFFNIFIITALIITLFVFIFSLIVTSMGPVIDQKNSALELVGRFFFMAIPAIFIARPFLDVLNNICQDIINTMDNLVSQQDSLASTTLNVRTTANLLISNTVLLLVTIILDLIIIVEFIKLLFEVIERYIVVIILQLASPIPFGLVVSRTTTAIPTNFMRMYLSQLFLLIMNRFFLLGFVSIMLHNSQSIFAYLFIITYLKVAQRIDSYMKSMGLTVAQTGGSLLDSVIMAAGTMKGMLSGAGNAMAAIGAATGSYGLASMGTSLSSMAKGTLSNDAANLDKFAKAGGLRHVKAGDPAQLAAFRRAFADGNYGAIQGKNATAALKDVLHGSGTEDAFKKATGISSNDIVSAKIDKYGNITGTAVTGSKMDGKPITTNFKASVTPIGGKEPSMTNLSDFAERYVSLSPAHEIQSGFTTDYSNGILETLAGHGTDDSRLSDLGVNMVQYDGENWNGYERTYDEEGKSVDELKYVYNPTTNQEMYAARGIGYNEETFKKELDVGGSLHYLTEDAESYGITKNNENSSLLAEFKPNTAHPNGFCIKVDLIGSADFDKQSHGKIIDCGKERGSIQIRKYSKK